MHCKFQCQEKILILILTSYYDEDDGHYHYRMRSGRGRSLPAAGHDGRQLLLQLEQKVGPVVREARLPGGHILILHHPQLAIGRLYQPTRLESEIIKISSCLKK